MELFDSEAQERMRREAPLAHRMRPRNLAEFVGQEHFLGKGKILRRAIDADQLVSLIFYGPPGCGKTALTQVIACHTRAHFSRLNAVMAGVSEVREILEQARQRRRINAQRTILFIDEIHRFNRVQQDALMPDVEEGNIIFIGATIYNPYFSVNSPLLSRSLILTFNPLTPAQLKTIVNRALQDKERGLGNYLIKLEEKALEHLITVSEGDARRVLNALELGVMTTKPDREKVIRFTLAVAIESIQKKVLLYDRQGDTHYDVSSAFIKSMRGSDPDAAVYWLARMLKGGEDPRFIARRIAICAAEDVGNADPQALVVANAAFQVVELVGIPEAQIPLAQAAIYVATAPKSNASYHAIAQAMKEVEEGKVSPVPAHLRDASYAGAKKLGHGKGYKYPHNFPGHWVEQVYLPKKHRFYKPADSGYEKIIRRFLAELRKSET